MANMTGGPYLNHVPALTGVIGQEEVRRFYGRLFIGHWPADTTIERISRTVGTDQVVGELVMSFTHDITTGHMLPHMPSMGKRVLGGVVVAGFRDGKLTHKHTYWDQASLLVQVGIAERGRAARHRSRAGRQAARPRTMPANAPLGPDWPSPLTAHRHGPHGHSHIWTICAQPPARSARDGWRVV
jgi:carboxymethylenebutenolidase